MQSVNIVIVFFFLLFFSSFIYFIIVGVVIHKMPSEYTFCCQEFLLDENKKPFIDFQVVSFKWKWRKKTKKKMEWVFFGLFFVVEFVVGFLSSCLSLFSIYTICVTQTSSIWTKKTASFHFILFTSFFPFVKVVFYRAIVRILTFKKLHCFSWPSYSFFFLSAGWLQVQTRKKTNRFPL